MKTANCKKLIEKYFFMALMCHQTIMSPLNVSKVKAIKPFNVTTAPSEYIWQKALEPIYT